MSQYCIKHRQHELVIEGKGAVDPYLLTRLLRHRPASLLPFTLIHRDEQPLFIFDLHGLESLGHYIHRNGRKASGKLLLLQLLHAVHLAKEALLWPDQDLLTPGLVFLSNDGHKMHVIALPLSVKPEQGSLLPIFTALQETDDFFGELKLKLQTLLTNDDFGEAIDLLQPLTTPTLEKIRGLDRIRDQLLLIQNRLSLVFQGKKTNQADRESEITAPIAISEVQTIGIISEGLPGTKEEELGEKAFILVDEFLFGRDSRKVDFLLDDEECGRLHARIMRRRQLFFLEDLGSKNGTYLDGQRLQKYREVLLPEQAKIRFGKRVYFFTCE